MCVGCYLYRLTGLYNALRSLMNSALDLHVRVNSNYCFRVFFSMFCAERGVGVANMYCLSVL